MKKTVFKITKMDCPSEENLIRLKLEDVSTIHGLEFDIPNRKLAVFYDDELELIETKLSDLNLDSSILGTTDVDKAQTSETSEQRKALVAVLVINLAFFIIEISTGIISKSMGLVADSLDMLADAFVYGISLFAVGGTINRKKQIAKTAGYFQIVLAIVGFVEVLRRVIFAEQMPDFKTMIIVSILALLANAICLYLLQRSKGKDEAHMKASLIFTSNDVVINLGVIIAAILVYVLNSSIPDLVIGSIVFVIVIRGAIRILKLGN
jgi:Co/Zn/Cd efflux system component